MACKDYTIKNALANKHTFRCADGLDISRMDRRVKATNVFGEPYPTTQEVRVMERMQLCANPFAFPV